MAVGSPGERSLKATPTWAVTLVCAVFVIVSVIIQLAIHSLGRWFNKRHKKALFEALEKIKAGIDGGDDDDNERRKLLSYAEDDILWRRALASAAKDDYCAKNGKVSLISYTGVHQLHIFIFVLAVFHVLYSVITIALVRAKMKKWKAWELETSSFEYQFTNGTTVELIIMEMAQEIQDRSTVVKGAPIVEPSNKYFWFNRSD
ncbi:MLO protein-1-like protein [Morus notabilis]|uniref:MLO protein-1-like protein n=1 Tax=Morus notabilis TaxID=981085 RepID=W9R619_9ROSA|nr:MLO protein-1-like protein [Morus notabilis]